MKALLTETFLIDEGKIIVTAYEGNFVFSVDIESGEVEYIDSIDGEDYFQERLFGDILEWNDRYVLVPANAKSIWVASKDFSEKRRIGLAEYNCALKFFKGFVIGDYLYLIPHLYPYMAKINLWTGSEEKVCDIVGERAFSAIMNSSHIIFSSFSTNKIVCYDYINEKVNKVNINGTYNYVSDINGSLYLGPRDYNAIGKFCNHKYEEFEIDTSSSVAPFLFNDEIYIITNKYVYKILEGKTIIKQINNKKYIGYKEAQKGIHCLLDSDGIMHIYDTNINEYKIIRIQLHDDFKLKINKQLLMKETLFTEKKIWGLKSFIDNL